MKLHHKDACLKKGPHSILEQQVTYIFQSDIKLPNIVEKKKKKEN